MHRNLPQCDNAPAPAVPGHGETAPLPTPMTHCLPQCGPALPPNVPLPAPMRAHAPPKCPIAYPDAPLPTPMRARAPPKRPIAHPDDPLPAPMWARPARRGPTRPPRASGGNAPVPLITPAYRVRCAVPSPRTAPTISRSRADHAPLANRTSTEATRCCAVRSSRPVSGSEATTHSPVAEGGSAVPASTSGPACGQAGPFAGKNHA